MKSDSQVVFGFFIICFFIIFTYFFIFKSFLIE